MCLDLHGFRSVLTPSLQPITSCVSGLHLNGRSVEWQIRCYLVGLPMVEYVSWTYFVFTSETRTSRLFKDISSAALASFRKLTQQEILICMNIVNPLVASCEASFYPVILKKKTKSLV